MTVSAQTAVNSSTGNGVTTVFPYTFKIIAAADLEVSVDGVVKTLTTHYTVSGAGDAAGGNVTFLTAPASGTTVVRRRNMAYTRTVDYQEQGDLRSDVLNPDQDAPVLMIQQLAEQVGRAVKFPLGETAPDSIELPALADRTGMYLAFDANGEITPSAGTGTDAGLRTDLAASTGSTLMGWIRNAVGAVARTVADWFEDQPSVMDYIPFATRVLIRLRTNTDDLKTYIDAAIAASAGKRLRFPAGTYNTSGGHNLNGLDGLQLVGEGPGASILNLTHASSNLFYIGATVTDNLLIDGFTITSSVTRTGGWVFAVVDAYNSTGALSNSTIRNLQIQDQVNGLWIAKYQFVNIENILAYDWVGTSGFGVKFGQATATDINQGSEVHCRGLQIYGNDIAGGAPILSSGIWIEDTDAVYLVDCGVGGVLDNDLVIKANTGGHAPSNHFFTGSVFDATKNSSCISFNGGGVVQHLMFSNCWIAAAGALTGGSAEACGIDFNSSVQYSHVTISGGTVKECKGSGIRINPALAGAFTISGVDINTNGAGAGTNRYGIHVVPTAAVALALQITGNNLSGNTPSDLYFNANSRDYSVVGNYLATGVTSLGASCNFSGNFDAAAASVASATTIAVSPCVSYVNITGTTNIGAITATYAGHIIMLRFNGILTVVDDSTNLRLAGNFTTAANSTLTLICDGAEWREIARANT